MPQLPLAANVQAVAVEDVEVKDLRQYDVIIAEGPSVVANPVVVRYTTVKCVDGVTTHDFGYIGKDGKKADCKDLQPELGIRRVVLGV